jgi:hypothetical protein
MPSLTGTILLVQESRFRLLTGQGRGALFLLAHDAPIEPQDLPPLIGRRVRVQYEEVPGLLAGIAREIEILDPQEERP